MKINKAVDITAIYIMHMTSKWLNSRNRNRDPYMYIYP